MITETKPWVMILPLLTKQHKTRLPPPPPPLPLPPPPPPPPPLKSPPPTIMTMVLFSRPIRKLGATACSTQKLFRLLHLHLLHLLLLLLLLLLQWSTSTDLLLLNFLELCPLPHPPFTGKQTKTLFF